LSWCPASGARSRTCARTGRRTASGARSNTHAQARTHTHTHTHAHTHTRLRARALEWNGCPPARRGGEFWAHILHVGRRAARPWGPSFGPNQQTSSLRDQARGPCAIKSAVSKTFVSARSRLSQDARSPQQNPLVARRRGQTRTTRRANVSNRWAGAVIRGDWQQPAACCYKLTGSALHTRKAPSTVNSMFAARGPHAVEACAVSAGVRIDGKVLPCSSKMTTFGMIRGTAPPCALSFQSYRSALVASFQPEATPKLRPSTANTVEDRNKRANDDTEPHREQQHRRPKPTNATQHPT